MGNLRLIRMVIFYMNILHMKKLIHQKWFKLWLLKKHQSIAMEVGVIMEVSSIIMKIQMEKFMHIFQREIMDILVHILLISKK